MTDNEILEIVIEEVSKEVNIDIRDIKGKGRKEEVKNTRQYCMYFGRIFTNLSTTEVGLALNKDHATVLHACKTVGNRINKDKAVRFEVEAIYRQIDRVIKRRRIKDDKKISLTKAYEILKAEGFLVNMFVVINEEKVFLTDDGIVKKGRQICEIPESKFQLLELIDKLKRKEL